MNINQAFEILARAGNAHDARVIIENTEKKFAWKIRRMARALRRGVPVAKIIHQKWFYGLKFYTNRHTLDPRPDTETLVAAVIADCGTGVMPNILDVGTGTGCIIAALVKNIHGAHGVAIDKSRGALRVARRNMRNLQMADVVRVMRGDFNNPRCVTEKFDLIVSNPPYIANGDKRVNVGAKHDPRRALYAKNGGYAAYESIAKNARGWLGDGGKIYLEIGAGMGEQVRKIFAQHGWKFVRSENDLSATERVLVFI